MSGAKFVRFYPSDWRSGCIGLTPEEEGVYMRVCAHFWETAVRLPLDDAAAASRLMLDVRMWRRIKAKLIGKGKLHVAEDGIFNPRAEHELDAAANAKAEAAVRVGATRRNADREQEDRRDSMEGRRPGANPVASDPPDMRESSDRHPGKVSENVGEKTNKINTPLKSRIEVEKRDKYDSPQSVTANGPSEIVGLNGSTAEIVEGIAKLLNSMAPDYVSAKRMITSNVSIYGAHAIRDGYAELMADIADNKVRVPSYKALLGYFKTASERPIGHAKQRQMSDYSSQRIERGREFLDLLNEGAAA